MMRCSTLIALATLMIRPATGDGWRSAYEEGLQFAHSGRWAEARASFKKAETFRNRDTDKASTLPGSPAKWRDGSPYSPNFLAAYAEYRVGLDCKDPLEQRKDFGLAQSEMDKLVNSGQQSRDAIFYLNLIDSRLNDQKDLAKLAKRSSSRNMRFSWKVDEEPLNVDEISAMQLMPNGPVPNPGTIVAAGAGTSQMVKPADLTMGGVGTAHNPNATGSGDVPHLSDKFALIIGQDSTQSGSLSCASYDAKAIRDGLVDYAGYDPKNVVLIQNASAASLMDQAKSLAASVSQDGIVFVYYAGLGSSIRGKDFLTATDSTSKYDTETMVSKSALYDLFLQKGARIFSFYEVNRPIDNGFFFGSEVPQSGAFSQMEATIPDANITTTVANGHPIGLYANSFVEVLAELRSNRIPIYEFGWQVYNKMKRGNTGMSSGGSHQTPTLPVLNNLAADARF